LYSVTFRLLMWVEMKQIFRRQCNITDNLRGYFCPVFAYHLLFLIISNGLQLQTSNSSVSQESSVRVSGNLETHAPPVSYVTTYSNEIYSSDSYQRVVIIPASYYRRMGLFLLTLNAINFHIRASDIG